MPTAKKNVDEEVEGLEENLEQSVEDDEFLAELLNGDAGGGDGEQQDDEESEEKSENPRDTAPARRPKGKDDAAKRAKSDDPFDAGYDEEIPEDDGDSRADAEGDGDEQDDSFEDEDGTAADNAVKALKLDGWTEEQIKALPQKVLLEVGEARAKAHAKADRAAAGRGNDRTGKAGDSTAAATKPTDKLIERLSGMMAVPEAQAKAALQELVDTITAPFAEVRNSMIRVEAHQARGRLQEKFPQLRSSKEFSETLNEAKRLLERDPETYRSIGHAMHAASKLRYADDLIEGAERRGAKERRARTVGSPSNPERSTSKGDTRLTRDQLEDAYLSASLDGNDAEKRRLGSLLNGNRRR